ncbi:hypothetical protein SDRG_01653 [Saprolegnia diclina VS20]|uniref:HECT-type E3 ubiquitin transferase n=1 Tax=Saprolegnia diclina (strain VS20) TaxID=1156394 RepID=T0R5L2_SAPDV|nr:hypothetical protein SDRG_01653 [Saprolegnia diclina VS20]EQC41695.1 hypothetical protein SDRG_01653 [Saprolegnia diclina VS20]|eukprot:XP_008605409.1 hypothetical protein SDRG_01653 [Saprolegnia diclina VS20]
MTRTTRLLCAMTLLATMPRAVHALSSDTPAWVWVLVGLGGAGAFVAIHYCIRQSGLLSSSLHHPFLGGQYTEDGQPLTRQNVQESREELDGQWHCTVCDFHNKPSVPTCVLCGTDQGFQFRLSSTAADKPPRSPSAACRQQSFIRRRMNMLNARQRGARNRQEWVRKLDTDGRRVWARSSHDEGQHSVAFVSQLTMSPKHPEGKMTFREYQDVDAAMSSRGYVISQEDLSVLEEVATLPFKDKYSWFLTQTSALLHPWEEGHLKMRVHRDNILVESMEQILGIQMEHIHMPLRIEFVGEVAIDAGGLEREWFAMVIEKLFDETIGLFMCAHVESLAYVINPNSVDVSVDHLLYFRGAGRLIGRALLEGQLMKAHLALPVLKHILGVPISFSDLEFIDHQLYKSMRYLKEHDGVQDMGLDFSVNHRKATGQVVTIDLKENGRHIEVNDANKSEYIYLHLRHVMLDSVAEQLHHLMAGIFEVIPQELILVFDYQELELILCGVPSIDLADWKTHTQCNEDMPPELWQWFWEVVGAFSDEERARLLQFTTGSSRVPVQGFKALTSYDGRICHFTLNTVAYPEHTFPRAHTCFNRIDLPKYKTKQELENVLTLVVNMEVTGFTDE